MGMLFIPALNRPETKRNIQIFVASTLIVCGTGLIFYILFQFSTKRTVNTGLPRINHSKEMFAKNLSFNGYKDAQKTLFFKADTVEVAQKKIGFFRIGFYKTAKIKGLQVDIFFYPEQKKPFEESVDLKQYFLNNESFVAFRLDNIKELNIRDVEINFYQNNHKVSSIQSDHAEINFYNKDLTFYGNVLIDCESKRTLHSPSLSWVGEENQFSTTDAYRLIKGESIFEGKGISCDYMLNKEIFFSEPKKYSKTF